MKVKVEIIPPQGVFLVECPQCRDQFQLRIAKDPVRIYCSSQCERAHTNPEVYDLLEWLSSKDNTKSS